MLWCLLLIQLNNLCITSRVSNTWLWSSYWCVLITVFCDALTFLIFFIITININNITQHLERSPMNPGILFASTSSSKHPIYLILKASKHFPSTCIIASMCLSSPLKSISSFISVKSLDHHLQHGNTKLSVSVHTILISPYLGFITS